MQKAKEQQAQYKDWLQAGLAKGMRPLYGALKKSERVLDRPFQNSLAKSAQGPGGSNGSKSGERCKVLHQSAKLCWMPPKPPRCPP